MLAQAPDALTPDALAANVLLPARRKVILHYHLFKNAGTSVDQMLKAHFGKRWRAAEAPHRAWGPAEIGKWLLAHPGVTVLSSHTAQLPVPCIDGLEIFPVMFLRHPLDRARSVYEFERKQAANTKGAVMAKQHSLKDYIAWRIGPMGDRTIRDFQCARLAQGTPALGKPPLAEELRAQQTLHSLPFIGIVESFDESVRRLQGYLVPTFPRIQLSPTKANVTQTRASTLGQRLEQLEADLGPEVYGQLVSANRRDLALYNEALQRNGSAQNGAQKNELTAGAG